MTLPRSSRRPSAGLASQLLVLGSVAMTTAGPLIWIVMLSLKSRPEFEAQPFALPEHLDFGNYMAVFANDEVPIFLANSVIAAGGALAVVLLCATLAAYAMARIPFAGSDALYLMFLAADAIPLVVVIVPLFVLMRLLGLGGSLLSVVLAYAAMGMGVSVYVLRGFFRSISSEIEEAARLDGCSIPQLIWFVILPMARPGLLVVGFNNLIGFWNEYFIATVLASGQSRFTLPAGLAATFVSKHSTNWPVMAAAMVLMMAPVLALFLIFQDRIFSGWTVSPR